MQQKTLGALWSRRVFRCNRLQNSCNAMHKQRFLNRRLQQLCNRCGIQRGFAPINNDDGPHSAKHILLQILSLCSTSKISSQSKTSRLCHSENTSLCTCVLHTLQYLTDFRIPKTYFLQMQAHLVSLLVEKHNPGSQMSNVSGPVNKTSQCK